MRLTGAKVTGRLDLAAATLVCGLVLTECELAEPLELTEAETRSLVLTDCQIPGISLQGARIRGSLVLTGSRVSGRDGVAINADRAVVEHNVRCGPGFVADGEWRLRAAHVKGWLDLTGARLTGPGRRALHARGLEVDQDAFFGAGFTAVGEISLPGARIGGRLAFTGAELSSPDGRIAKFELLRAGALVLLPSAAPAGLIDLTGAQVGSYQDDPDTWPTSLRLRGFSYEVLRADALPIRQRLAWLARHEGYAPGAYDQLAAAYRRAGRVEDARRVGLAKQWRRRRELGAFGKAWNWLLYLTVGYGYRTWLALPWLAVLTLLGALVFGPDSVRAAGTAVPGFDRVAYALDVLLPIVDLGQQRAWLAQGPAQVWTWVLIGAGWLLTTAVVAGLTNALKRD